MHSKRHRFDERMQTFGMRDDERCFRSGDIPTFARSGDRDANLISTRTREEGIEGVRLQGQWRMNLIADDENLVFTS